MTVYKLISFLFQIRNILNIASDTKYGFKLPQLNNQN